MSPLDRPVPPAGEHIHIPGASAQPILMTAAITLVLIGVTLGMPLLIAGLIMFVSVTARWVRDTRREMAELPEDLDEH